MPTNSNELPRLWFAKVGSKPSLIEPASLEHQTLEQLSDSEHSRLELIKSSHKRQEYLLSRALMRHALSDQFGLKPEAWEFIEKKDSAPIVQNLPEGYWLSLSHSHGAICFVLHNQPVGIDLEQAKTRTNFLPLARAFMNDNELELLNSDKHSTTEIFYKIWCAKEAFYKMLTPAEQEGLFLKKINYLDLVNSHHLVPGKINDCQLALVTNEAPRETSELRVHTFSGPIQISWG